MFFLSFTTPADKRKRKTRPPREAPSRRQVSLTWGLLFVWLVLMSFGIVSLADPEWLQELSRPGVEAEARAYKDYGDDALRRHDYGSAVAQYERSLEIKPGQVRVLLNLAIAYMHAGNAVRAAELLNSALQMESTDFIRGAVFYNYGELLERQGRRPEALDYYRQAVESGAEQDKVYRKLGSLYFDMQQYEKARDAFEKALAHQLDPCRSYRDMLYRSLDIYESDTTYLPIIEERLAGHTTPDDLAPFDLELIRQLQQSDTEIAKTHNHLGVICAQLKDTAEAARHFRRSLEIWPGNTDATRNLALLQRLQPAPP
jgi:tetratricopeptide (TPR) repeat protein